VKQEKKKTQVDLKIFSLTDSEKDPTVKEIEFILHDFEESLNKTIISEETAEKVLFSLAHKPIVCKYYPESESGKGDDALGGHEAYIGKDRDNNNIVLTNTVTVGVFTEPAYIEEIEVDGVKKKVVKGKGILHKSRYPNIVDMLEDWYSDDSLDGIFSSMEILYDEYHVKDGVEEILNYLYDGHCILNSKETVDHNIVPPAYPVSQITKFEKMVAQAITQEKEVYNMEKEMKKKVLEMSYSDIQWALDSEVAKEIEDKDTWTWIQDVYDDRFVVSINGVKYEMTYTKDEDDNFTIDFENKVEVIEKSEWVKVQNSQDELIKDLEAKVAKFEEEASKEEEVPAEGAVEGEGNEAGEANEAEESTEGSEEDAVVKEEANEGLEGKYQEATEKVIALKEQLEAKTEELEGIKEFKELYEKEVFEKALAEKQEYYKEKFEAVGLEDEFEGEEVQKLVSEAVNSSEAKISLNEMLVEAVTVAKEDEVEKANSESNKEMIKELNSKQDNLLPKSVKTFSERYGYQE